VKLAVLAAKLAGFVGARLAGAAIGFISQFLLARLLSVADVGVVLMGMSAASFVSLGANGGYALLAMTQLPKIATHGRQRLIDAFNNSAAFDGAVAFSVICVLGLAAAYWMDFSQGQLIALGIGTLCAPASATIRFNSSVATAERRYHLAYVPDFIIRPLMFLVFLIFVFLTNFKIDAVYIMLAFAVTAYIAALGQARSLGKNAMTVRHIQRPPALYARRMRSRAFALTLVSAAMLAIADIVTLLSGFLLHEDEVAIVGITVRLAAIAGFVLQAGQMLVLTDFTQALVAKNQPMVRQLLLRINLMTLAIVGGSLLGGILLGEYVLSYFGDVYRQGAWLLVMFLIAQSIRAAGGMNQHILSINGYQVRMAGMCLATLAFLLLLAVVLSQKFGYFGIGYALIGYELSWLVLAGYQAQKHCGQRGDLLWLLQAR
jgi:O-antigen/teichoic acid export membrane protein